MTDKGSDEGIRLLEQHLAEKPQSERFAELAEAYVASGRFDEAVEICENGLGYHPSLPAGHLVYGKALVCMDRLTEGIQAFERAGALRTNDAGLYAEIGQFLTDQDHHQEAIPYLQNGLRLVPDDPRVLHLKECLESALDVEFERAETGRWQRPVGLGVDGGEGPGFEVETDQLDSPEFEQAEDPDGDSLDDDDDDDEPPTVYDVNPLARQQAQEPEEQPAEESSLQAQQPAERTDETLYDPEAGLRAEVSHAVDELGEGREGEPPTRYDVDAEDAAIAAPDRNEPPTMFEAGQDEPAPWEQDPSQPGRPRAAEGLTAEQQSPGAKPDATRVSTSRPRGPMFPEPEPAPAPTTTISYWKIFLVVVPFLLAAVAGGLYFGYRHLRNEKITSLLEQSLGAMTQDTFAGYTDARQTLLKLLELEEDHPRGRSLLALVSARLHDEYGPNLQLRDDARQILSSTEPEDESRTDLLWARYHVSDDSAEALRSDLDKALRVTPKEPRLMALAGELSIRQGDLKEGTQWLQASLAEAPSNPRTLAKLAELELQAGSERMATEHLVRALAINAIHVRSLLTLARMRVAKGNELDQAKEDLEKVLKLPEVTAANRSEAHLLYANLTFKVGERSRALAAVKAASDLRSDEADFQQRLAELCREYYALDEAEFHAKRLVELKPDDMGARLFLIGTYLPRGRYAQALAALNELVGKKVPAAPFLLLRGRALLGLGKPGAAINDLSGVPDGSDQRPEAWALTVLALLEAGDLERARREVLELNKKAPDLPVAQLAMGRYREKKGLRRGAAAAYRKAIELDPRFYQAHVALARMALDGGKLDEAERHLREALTANPYSIQAHYLLGQVKLRTDDCEAALDAFARVVKEQPDSGPGLVGMAEALLDLGRLDKAVLAIRKGRKAGAEDAHARHVEGQVYLANGRFHTAIRALTAADELSPRDPEILADLGLALLGVRSMSRAEKAFEESLRRSRRWQRLPRAQEGLAKVLLAKRKIPEAAGAFERAAVYARQRKRPKADIARLYLQAGRTMLRDTRAKDKRYGRARRLFRKAAQHAPEDPEPVYEVAAAYDREEKLRSARKWYQKVLEIKADHPMTLYRLGLLEFDEGKDQRAKELLERFLQTKPKGKLARMARRVLKRIK